MRKTSTSPRLCEHSLTPHTVVSSFTLLPPRAAYLQRKLLAVSGGGKDIIVSSFLDYLIGKASWTGKVGDVVYNIDKSVFAFRKSAAQTLAGGSVERVATLDIGYTLRLSKLFKDSGKVCWKSLCLLLLRRAA